MASLDAVAARLAELHRRGAVLALSPPAAIDLDAPASMLTAALDRWFLDHQAEIVTILERLEERAAMIEFEAGATRSDAEREAWAQLTKPMKS